MQRINNSLKIRIRKPDTETVLLYLWLFELFALTITRFMLSRIGISEGLMRSCVLWGIATIPIIVFLLNIQRFEPKKYLPFLFLLLFVIISIAISEVANPDLEVYYKRANYGLDRILRPDCALYAFLFFVLFDDPVKLRNNVKNYAFFDFAYLIVVELIPALSRGYWIDIAPSGREMHLSYSLSFGYSILFPTIIFLYYAIKEKKTYYLILSLIGIWCVLTQGNRGALLIPIIFVSMMVISGIVSSDNVSKKTLKIAGVLFAIAIIIACRQPITDAALHALSRSGISSRNVEMMLSGKLSNDNGREIIWSTVIRAIRDGGLLGYGVLGDRPFVSPIHYVGYSHNLFLELIVSYGIIGALISAYIVIDAIWIIFFCKNNDWRELYIIFFCISCQLMLSMSFWYVWEFWAAAAIAYKCRKMKKVATARV